MGSVSGIVCCPMIELSPVVLSKFSRGRVKVGTHQDLF